MAVQPDVGHLAWNSNINRWETYVNGLANIPAYHYSHYPDFLLRPMPVVAKFAFNSQRSSLLFWWDKSFILKNKPLFYEVQVASDEKFLNKSVNVVTEKTYHSVATCM